jgi:hypothetical protein
VNEIDVRASDADREQTVALLREHAAAGRLTLEEFTERMSAAYEARTTRDLDELARDLPRTPATSRRRPTRFLAAVFGSTERAGRLRIRRRVASFVLFGNVDLDLRQATLEGDVITVVAFVAFGATDVYVPEGVDVEVHGLTVFGHKNARNEEAPTQPGAPLVRMYAFGLFAGIDAWRVPREWAQRTAREIIRGIRRGDHRKELTQ